MRFMTRSNEPLPMRIRRRRLMQRRALYAAGATAALIAVCATGWLLGRADHVAGDLQARLAAFGADANLRVASVQVEGRERADGQAILTALGVARGTPILSIDLDAAKARLETVPWIRSVSIQRLLPDTLLVRLTERAPLALWQHGGKFDLVDSDGNVVINANVSAFPSLPQVVGDGAPAATPNLLALLATEPTLQNHVIAAVRVGDRRWNIDFDTNIEVALPEDNAAAAWHRLAALDHSDRILARNVQAIDLRLPDRLVLRVAPDLAKTLIKKSKPNQASPNT